MVAREIVPGRVLREGETLRVLVDCGLSFSLLKRKLLNRGIPEDIHGVFVTHEHSDHCKGIVR